MGNRTVTKFVIGTKSLEQSEDGICYWIVNIDGIELKTEVSAKCTLIVPTVEMIQSGEINAKNTIFHADTNFRECFKMWIGGSNCLIVNCRHFQFEVDFSKNPCFEQWDIESQALLHFSHRVYVITNKVVTINLQASFVEPQ